MTYCVGLLMNAGLVLLSDTRTNAGVDNISTFNKMKNWTVPGERMITIMTAGNLATTQAAISLLEERASAPEDRAPSIMQAPTMFQVATIIGDTLRGVVQSAANSSGLHSSTFSANMIVAGQIAGSPPRLFMIYPEGNFIEACDDTPFFQIGETKYGRPIIVRAFEPNMSFEDAVKLLLVSFDSTAKANLSVALPLDMQVYEQDSLTEGRRFRITGEDAYFQMISKGWGEALRQAFHALPPFSFENR